jgi:hypothetical protein
MSELLRMIIQFYLIFSSFFLVDDWHFGGNNPSAYHPLEAQYESVCGWMNPDRIASRFLIL